MSRIGNRSFTLLEVLVTTAVLSLGIVTVYQAFFVSLDAFDYASNYLSVAPFLSQQLAACQDVLVHYGTLPESMKTGEFDRNNRRFSWLVTYESVAEGESERASLYKINLDLSWQQGRRTIHVNYSNYALYGRSA